MVFSSLLFTFFFLPFVVCVYYLSKEEYRNYILLVASLLFYAYGEPHIVFVMLVSIGVNYGFAIGIDWCRATGNSYKKLFLILGIAFNLGLLFLFKYLGFSVSVWNRLFHLQLAVRTFHLPIGISFYTFQALSYVIDVYWGKVKVQKNPLLLALYISFFPQLIAGPIVRYRTIENQMTNRVCTVEKFGDGVRRFFLGFCKKVLLANNLSLVAEQVFGMSDSIDTVNPVLLWLGSVCYSLQIFYDFSGYSDMAIGLGKMFGFCFEENFNYPYISKSVTEFWRRWHISLGQWFRDYVYIPLGGSRVAVPRQIANLFIVWVLTGIWHGANWTFIAWGLWYFMLLVIEKFLVRPTERGKWFLPFWQIVTLACVNFGWVVFNSASLWQGIQFCLAMLGYYHIAWQIDTSVVRLLREYGIFLVAGVVFAMPIVKVLAAKWNERFGGKYEAISAVAGVTAYGCVFLWAVSYIILGTHNPFIYFNF